VALFLVQGTLLERLQQRFRCRDKDQYVGSDSHGYSSQCPRRGMRLNGRVASRRNHRRFRRASTHRAPDASIWCGQEKTLRSHDAQPYAFQMDGTYWESAWQRITCSSVMRNGGKPLPRALCAGNSSQEEPLSPERTTIRRDSARVMSIYLPLPNGSLTRAESSMSDFAFSKAAHSACSRSA
jgi:hypothetical protein